MKEIKKFVNKYCTKLIGVNYVWIYFAILFFVVVSGCFRSSAPSDLPKLYPCTITITQDNKPLEGATVELIVSEGQAKYKAVTVTDSRGVAIMSTYGYNGAPSGKYKVVVTKKIEDDFIYGVSSTGAKEVSSSTHYRTVEPKFSNPKTTPHEIEINNNGKITEANFDVGKPIKEKL
jgi:hypothetical protein